MKVLLLAGGFGTRISEETGIRPKPMVEIGGKPILWHIMKIYSQYGFNDFVILLGYKGEYIKNYFLNYYNSQSSIQVDLVNNTYSTVDDSNVEPWKVTLLDTGLNNMTGSRIKQAQKVVGDDPFLLTYGDGVADIDVLKSIEEHNKSGKHITMTTIQPEGRFGALEFDENNNVVGFTEKPKGDTGWINGGFFVCSPEVFNYIGDASDEVFERNPLEKLAKENQINSYFHDGFWKCMDTLADKNKLNDAWSKQEAKWKTW